MNTYPTELKDLASKYKGKRTSNLTRWKPPIYLKLVEWTSFLPENSSATQRLFHVEHDLFEIPKCKNNNCENTVNWIKEYKPSRYAEFCSTKCTASHESTISKRKETNKLLYGVDSFSKTNEFKNKIKSIDAKVWDKANEKRKKTSLKKYGVEYAHLTENAIEKKKKTNLEKFGHENVLASEYVKSIKREKYGTENYVEVPEFKEKRRETMLEKYGVEYSGQSKLLEQKRKETLLNKYGETSFSKTNEFKNSLRETYNAKHGVDHHTQIHLSNDTINKINDKQWLYEQHYDNNRTISDIATELKIHVSTLCDYYHKHGIIIRKFNQSTAEKEISDLLSHHDIIHETNTRSVIPPYELDIFVPEHNLAIEYCGLYWHSTAVNKSKNYHLNKLQLCNESGIRLITLFEDEWIHNKEIVKNKLIHLLNKNKNKSIYARSCKIKIIDSKTKKDFFDKNHIQGDGPSSINIALTYNDKIVACIAFIKNSKKYTLNRYATSEKVVGGFSKLLKYFQRNYEWNEIITFADLRWSDGSLYEKTGFKLQKVLSPDYYYVDLRNIKRLHKFNFRHKNLQNILEKYDPNLSESENAKINNWHRIYNCGLKKYILENI